MKRGYEAYAKAHAGSLKDRNIEAEALLKAARLLAEADIDRADVRALAKALNFNLKLWTVFEADLNADQNRLPTQVRADLLRLCRYMTAEVARATRQPKSADLQAMVEINRTLASGLMD